MPSLDNGLFESQAQDFCRDFLENDVSRRFLMGLNEYSAALASEVEVCGFVDDWTTLQEFCGRPVLRTEALDGAALVVSCSVGIRPLTARRRLKDAGLRCLDYYAFRRFSGIVLPQVSLLLGLDEQGDVQEEIAWLRARLGDTTSIETLDRLVGFRETYDLNWLEGFEDRQTEQYFEGLSLALASNDHIFVDAGCFDGATSRQFISLCPNYRHIYALEPLAENLQNVKLGLDGYRDVTILPKGLFSSEKVLTFQAGGSASAISEHGDTTVDVGRLDHLVEGPVTFIKMDIEGAELEALDGCRQKIVDFQPILALCVYHRPSDLWTIPKKVLSFGVDYTVHLRHYTEGVTETVMYFIPRGTAGVRL